MSDVEARSCSPTCAVPPMVGAPVAGVFADGPSTVADGLFDSSRPSAVHTAPAALHSRPPGSSTVTAWRESGARVTTHRSARPPDCRTPMALPPATVNAAMPTLATSSLNETRKLNVAPAPPCSAGTSEKLAVSGSVDSVFRIVPVAAASPSSAPEALLSVSVNVSPSSSTASSVIGTDTVFSVSPAAKVSVPLVAV